jgi:hypothetical protein
MVNRTVVKSSCGGPGCDSVCLLCKKRHDTYKGLLVFGGGGGRGTVHCTRYLVIFGHPALVQRVPGAPPGV